MPLSREVLKGGGTVTLEGVSHWFDAPVGGERVKVLDGVSILVPAGQFIAIVGPSGCGKTTLLNMVGGLVRPGEGRVTVAGASPKLGAAEVGYLFARDGLLPWRTALGNVELALELRGISRRLRAHRALAALGAVGLADFAHAYPAQLSQGMRQRVALARTTVTEPMTLLMDEPFSALDAQTRLVMHEQFLGLWEKDRRTVLFITHDLGEAVTLADRVVVLSRRPGRVKGDFLIDLPRPRHVSDVQGSKTYHAVYQNIWSVFQEEVFDNVPNGT